MQVATGTVIAAKRILEGLDLPDGETVHVLTREAEEEVEPPGAIAEADCGETVSAEELFEGSSDNRHCFSLEPRTWN